MKEKNNTRKAKFAKYRPADDSIKNKEESNKILDNSKVDMNSFVVSYRKRRTKKYLIYYLAVTIFALALFVLLFLGIKYLWKMLLLL